MAAVSSSLLFGASLDLLFNQVDGLINKTIRTATKGALEVEIQAGRQIQAAIENAKNAYQDCLNTTVDKVSRAANEALATLQSVVDEFERKTYEDLTSLMDRVQIVVNDLPFIEHRSQLMSVSPQYIVMERVVAAAFAQQGASSSTDPEPALAPQEPSITVVTFGGSFPWLDYKGCTPSLSFDGQTCKYMQSLGKALNFEVPSTIFNRDHLPAYKTGILHAPWYTSNWWWATKVPGEFRVALGAMPASPGTITVEYRLIGPERETVSSREIPLDGNQYLNLHEPNHKVIEQISPDDGWFVDASIEPKMVVTHSRGYYQYHVENVTPRGFQCIVDLNTQDHHHAGVMSFHVVYQRLRHVEPPRAVDLQWGGSALVTPPIGQEISRITFTDYKGLIHQYGGHGEFSEGVLKISVEGQNRRLVIELPRYL